MEVVDAGVLAAVNPCLFKWTLLKISSFLLRTYVPNAINRRSHLHFYLPITTYSFTPPPSTKLDAIAKNKHDRSITVNAKHTYMAYIIRSK